MRADYLALEAAIPVGTSVQCTLPTYVSDCMQLLCCVCVQARSELMEPMSPADDEPNPRHGFCRGECAEPGPGASCAALWRSAALTLEAVAGWQCVYQCFCWERWQSAKAENFCVAPVYSLSRSVVSRRDPRRCRFTISQRGRNTTIVVKLRPLITSGSVPCQNDGLIGSPFLGALQ